MTGIAYAQAGAAPPAAGGLAGILPIILIIGVFYFLLIRPQTKKAKEHQEFVNNLKKGDNVVTSGGIHGKVTGMTDTVVTMEIADNVRIKINRQSVLASATDAKKAEAIDKPSGG